MDRPRPDNPGREVRRSLMVAAAACAFAHCAVAGSAIPDYGFQWSTVTHAGNAPIPLPTGNPPIPPFPQTFAAGQVNHDYRIMTREVTIGQWFDFVRAYAPYVDPLKASSTEFTGAGGIQFTGFNQQRVPTYALSQSRRNEPVFASWRFGARLANYLHNGAPDAAHATAEDFEQGAYDTSTFATVPTPGGGNHITDQAARSPGAQFFFPTFDEWVKAAYFDPNKNGPGQPGYWQYPITSDTAPIADSPQFGGQTNTGPFPSGHPRPRNVGSYPGARSPWGLLDISGGATEWLENLDTFLTIQQGALPSGRAINGSNVGSPGNPALSDVLHRPGYDAAETLWGMRLASVVPTPGTVLAVSVPALLSFVRRKRSCASMPTRSSRRSTRAASASGF